MRRFIILVPALVVGCLALTACADLLGGVGDLSRSVVHGDGSSTTSTTEPGEAPTVPLAPVASATWANDGLGVDTVGMSREALVGSVWARNEEASSFVQASRREIVDALPGIEFPELLPPATTHISSQLVFDEQTGTLDVSTAAAFGIWVGEPYAQPRSEAQLAVIRVGIRGPATGPDGEYALFQVSEGRELAWAQDAYVYQLFCRTGITEEACFAIAESFFPLRGLLGASN